LEAGLSDLLADHSGTGNSSIISSFSFSFSSSSSSDSTSHERGVRIDGVTTAGGEAALLFLFYFFFAALTAETATAMAEADFFATADLVLLRRAFAAPPASGAAPGISTSGLITGILVGLHRRV
jgi:hypothetical protein